MRENKIEFSAVGRYLNYLLLITDKGIIAFNTEAESFYIWNEKINAEYIFGDENNPIIISNDGVYILSELENDFFFSTAILDLNYPDKYKKLNKILVNAEGGEIAIKISGKPIIFRKIRKNIPIFLNVPRVKSFSITLKNCNNFESVIFYYTLY